MTLAISGVDLAVLCCYLMAVVALGLWLGRGQRNVSDYFLGGRNLPWGAVLLSIVATETSTVTFLSIPGKAFGEGGDFRFLQLAFGLILGRLVVSLLFLPHYFRGDLFTAYEVLDRRFGGMTKQIASLLFLVTRNLSDGLRLFLTAIVLEKAVGLPLPVCILVLGLATIVYTFVGGMRSVVWNDCVQFVVYILGAVIALGVMVWRLPGGWTQVLDFASQQDKFRLFDFSLSPTSETMTFWAGVVGGLFLALSTHGTDQMMVQRYLAARNQRDAGRALVISGLIICAQFALFLLIGVSLACFYHELHPGHRFGANDEVFASFIVSYLPVGVVGIILAAVFSAAMSTLSSSLNSSATAAVNDFYLASQRRKPDDRRLLKVSRILTVFFGLVQIGIGITCHYLAMERSVVDSVLIVAGFAGGLILGVFFLGVLTTRVSQRAAVVGLVGGLAILCSIAFGTPVNGFWYTMIGSGATFLVGMTASLVWPNQNAD